jgi:hypothetical protein
MSEIPLLMPMAAMSLSVGLGLCVTISMLALMDPRKPLILLFHAFNPDSHIMLIRVFY